MIQFRIITIQIHSMLFILNLAKKDCTQFLENVFVIIAVIFNNTVDLYKIRAKKSTR